MRDFMGETVPNPVLEARRYVANAKELLEKNGQLDYETQSYSDRKYVRMAGNTLWNGVLLILEEVFHIKSKEHPHPDIIDYKEAIKKRDGKLLRLVIIAYETIHIYMGYDGNPGRSLCSEGFRFANDIIDRCAKML